MVDLKEEESRLAIVSDIKVSDVTISGIAIRRC
jgi:hypothetical protein